VARAHRLLAAAVALVACLPASPRAVGRERVPVDHWCYPALERFETLGWCTLPETRPLGRAEIRAVVAAVAARVRESGSPAMLSARDAYELDRLEHEFTATDDPRERWDRALFAEDGSVAVEGDFDLRPYLERAPGSDETEVFVGADPTAKVHLGARVSYDLRYRLLFGPEHGARARDQKPSRREKSFKGLTSLYDRSYVVGTFEPVDVLVGREQIDWGPGAGGGLIVPGARHTVDQLAFRLKFRSLRLDAFYGQLFTAPERYMVGHRLEVALGATVLGLSETVVYGGRPLDWLYLFPLSWYYANQFNERTNEDNILWSLDAKTTIAGRVTLFGSLLVDDFQFERSQGYPDKLAYDVGLRWVPARPLGLELRGRYRRVDIYTYSHLDSLSVYVSGAGEIAQGDVLLGGDPGPDADEWGVAAAVYPRADLALTLSGAGRRAGEGGDVRAFDLGVDPADPPFPSGVVERTIAVGLGARWEFKGDSWFAASYAHTRVENRAHAAGDDGDDDSFRLEIRWDIP
jgi:hypothetical protein